MSTRKTFWVSLVLLLTACFSTWLMLKNHQNKFTPNDNLQNKPDAYMYNATYYEYDKTGQLHSRLDAVKTTHIPYKNSAEFISPVFLTYTDKRLPWYISSKTGHSENGIDTIHLHDNVELYQPASPTYPATKITTTVLTIHPVKSTADTKAHAAILRPGIDLEAKGMHVDFAKNRIKLISQANASYDETVATEATKPDNADHAKTDH